MQNSRDQGHWFITCQQQWHLKHKEDACLHCLSFLPSWWDNSASFPQFPQRLSLQVLFPFSSTIIVQRKWLSADTVQTPKIAVGMFHSQHLAQCANGIGNKLLRQILHVHSSIALPWLRLRGTMPLSVATSISRHPLSNDSLFTTINKISAQRWAGDNISYWKKRNEKGFWYWKADASPGSMTD